KESAMDLWLINKNPQVLPYLAIAYHCMDETSVGDHWLQQCRCSLPKKEQKELADSIGSHIPANLKPQIHLMLNKLAA
ncbi:hypothetical protein ABMA58_11750, partial [Oceanospirillum sp. HFRX-1_2]